MTKGYVALVGAGPGDASLLTLRGKELLEMAQVIVYDRLVSQEIMTMIPDGRKLIHVGKEHNHHPIPQEEINRILVREALEGQVVVRLKGGDSFVFGRGGEEIEALLVEGIPFEVVPGITSAIAAPAFAGIPVTHRDYCSSFHVITGHQKKNELLEIDYESLVRTKGTLIFLMGVASLQHICNGLIQGGMDENMPAAIVENGTRSYQRKLVGTLGNLYTQAVAEQYQSPSVIIVGKVCALSEKFHWFMNGPLHGQEIIVTSPANTSGRLQKHLQELGACVYHLPMIEIKQLEGEALLESLREEIRIMKDTAYLVFTSKNGVEMFFGMIDKMQLDSRILWNIKVVSIGPSTAQALQIHGVKADFIPRKFNTKGLIEEFIPEIGSGEKVLILRGQKGHEDLIEGMKEAKVSYRELNLYDTDFVSQPTISELTVTKKIVCFTSASTVESFMQNQPNVENIYGICIGEQTSAMAHNYGISHEVSSEATLDSIVEKIMEVTQNRRAENEY